MDPYISSYLERNNVRIRKTLERIPASDSFILRLDESMDCMIDGGLVTFSRGVYAFFSDGIFLTSYSPRASIEDCALLFAKYNEHYEDAARIRDIIEEQNKIREQLSLQRIKADPKIQSQIESLLLKK